MTKDEILNVAHAPWQDEGKTNMFSSFAATRRYLKLFGSLEGKRAALAFNLMCLTSLLNGFGILMLLPLFQVIGVDGEPHGISGYVARLFELVGIDRSLGNVLVAFVILVAAHALLARWLILLNTDIQFSFTRSLQNRLYTAMMHADWLFFVRTRSSDFTHALTSNISQVASGTTFFLRLPSAMVITGIHVILSVAISPLMSTITLACAVVFWCLLSRQNRLAHQTGQELIRLNQGFYADISDHLAGMKEAKSLGSEDRHIDMFASATAAIKSTFLRYFRARENTSLCYTIGSAVLLAVLLYFAVKVLQMPLVELMVLVFIFSRLMPRLREIHTGYQQVLHMLPAFDSVMDLQSRCELSREDQPATPHPVQLQREISLSNVGFRYDRDGPTWALRGVSLTIPTGSATAIVGRSGAGKSTLADVLMGLLVPEEGYFQVDDVRLDRERLFAWRQCIGYVPQETFLLHHSIRENLLWAKPTATDEELRQALKLAAADEFVRGLPQGLETIVGDRGVRLSGGERQRIALARALLRRPSVLILDEATSALDAENQRRIQEAVRKLHGELTIVIIAHRLSTVRIADQIVVLENGRVAESGTYVELASRREGHFRILIEADQETALTE